MSSIVNNNSGINNGHQIFTYNHYSKKLNGVQSEVVKIMDMLPMSKQANILVKIAKKYVKCD